MNTKTMILSVVGATLLTACGGKAEQRTEQKKDVFTPQSLQSEVKVTDCDITFCDVHFDKALNGGDSLVTVEDGVLRFVCCEGRDFYNDPIDELNYNSLPAILTEVDNTQPFMLTAKVTPGFTDEGLYFAGVLFLYGSDTLWQKLCFEQDERGRHRMVTVITNGKSDDGHHNFIEGDTAWMRITSDTRSIASYYSLDGKDWEMIRMYQNFYPYRLLVGLSSQAPQTGTCTSLFEDVSLVTGDVENFSWAELKK